MYAIFAYIYHTNQPHVGKYTSPMDPMGKKGYKFQDLFGPFRSPKSKIAGHVGFHVSGIQWLQGFHRKDVWISPRHHQEPIEELFQIGKSPSLLLSLELPEPGGSTTWIWMESCVFLPVPIHVTGIFTYIYLDLPYTSTNCIGKYTIHGSYGFLSPHCPYLYHTVLVIFG